MSEICNMKFLKSFFSNNHGLSLLLFLVTNQLFIL
jgi:hypothetical protein